MAAAGQVLRRLSQSLSRYTGVTGEVYHQFLLGTANYCLKLFTNPGYKYADPSSFALLSLASSTGKYAQPHLL